MSSPSRIDLFKEAMSIEKERAALQGKLDQVLARLERIKNALFSDSGVTAATPVAKKAAPVAGKAAPAVTPGRAPRGELKGRIFAALGAAGKAGMRVRDLAAELGAKPEALHSWFQFARKTIPAIRKAGKGRYRLVGPVPAAAPAAPTPAKAAPKALKSVGSKRGELSAGIQDALKAAGKDGARVGDLAKQFGMNPRNLFVWFSTTGKNFKDIKKVGPGHYRLAS